MRRKIILSFRPSKGESTESSTDYADFTDNNLDS